MPPKSKSTTTEEKTLKNDNAKKKASRACIPCRKRKVKCDGLFPCERCLKADTTCVYDKPQQKKDSALRQHIDINEARLDRIEQFLKHFSIMLDTANDEVVDAPLLANRDQMRFEDIIGPDQKLCIQPSGKGLYTTKSQQTQHLQYLESQHRQPVLFHLISIYFQYIDPIIPILDRPTFFHLLQNNLISDLLLNAIYCVSARWDAANQHVSITKYYLAPTTDQPRGWIYYQNAVKLLDKESEPNIATMQAVFLLLKYSEHVRRPGFIWRTMYYHQILIQMCTDLGLQPSSTITIENNVQQPRSTSTVDAEIRRRIFWAVYCYDVMLRYGTAVMRYNSNLIICKIVYKLSAESGTLPHFNISEIDEKDLPTILYNDTIESFMEHQKILQFVMNIRILQNQANILHYLHNKFNRISPFAPIYNHILTQETLESQLRTTLNLIISTIPPPTRQNMRYTTCFLYFICNFTMILLYQHLDLNRCQEPALHIRQLTELVLECNAFEDMYCSIRGIQQIIHYLSASNTIFMKLNMKEELQQTLQLTKQLASVSPLTEVILNR
ncbi:fungal-specific transcription factor domain-containing protein [Mycotypha africana]|uniref:fungal-specific transcription factor domain-containing protein n=1 Tax=Mycotypha africana TaxID=64632 RepID=UPI0023012417|nr:fungal-specific transcription factor domain-containing protein [Mycotypha africana]KAI8970196.1 fungal-specific transcription factor domain-containing protein [Mycotypha africana]